MIGFDSMKVVLLMTDQEKFLEEIWGALLSREVDMIRQAYSSLDVGSRKAVLNHLHTMVTDTGWHPEQVLSAQAALDALKEYEANHGH